MLAVKSVGGFPLGAFTRVHGLVHLVVVEVAGIGGLNVVLDPFVQKLRILSYFTGMSFELGIQHAKASIECTISQTEYHEYRVVGMRVEDDGLSDHDRPFFVQRKKPRELRINPTLLIVALVD